MQEVVNLPARVKVLDVGGLALSVTMFKQLDEGCCWDWESDQEVAGVHLIGRVNFYWEDAPRRDPDTERTQNHVLWTDGKSLLRDLVPCGSCHRERLKSLSESQKSSERLLYEFYKKTGSLPLILLVGE